MNITITGGCGFQGSHLAEFFSKRGDSVVILNTPSLHARENYERHVKDLKNVEVVWGSVLNRDLVAQCVQGSELVLHLGAKINVDRSAVIPEVYMENNVRGTINVMNEVHRRKDEIELVYASTCEVYGANLLGTFNVLESIKRFRPDAVFVSSAAVYGDEGGNYLMNELHPLMPKSPYAASKAAADRWVHAYTQTHKLRCKIIRPFNIYGPRQKSRGGGSVIPIFFRQAMLDDDITVFGSGKQQRDYTYIDDLVNAYITVIECDDLVGKEVNIGTGVGTPINDIAHSVASITGTGRVVHKNERAGEVSQFLCDASLIRSYGWEPRVSIEDGLNLYHRWLAME
tara:strand:+ start:10392 stop:11417 length:1026 start_codon:yes stop_codon:yes gene_type:complete